MRFRERLSDALERASLPGLSDDRIREMLTLVVIGAGPTGVELCGELRDFVEQDVKRLYRRLLPHVRIVLLEASDKVRHTPYTHVRLFFFTELCGELRDFVEQDVKRLYRRLLPHVRIVLLEASDKVRFTPLHSFSLYESVWRDFVEQDVKRLYRRLLPHVWIVLLEASDKVRHTPYTHVFSPSRNSEGS
jgi:NADH dehydrogenase FAD-containing subunit